jgi:hypothetical protein
MSLKRVITTGREIDKQWQRWRSPERRRLLVNARTAMNYSTIAPIVQRMQADPRLEFYFTASEDPSRISEIYAEAVQPFKFVTPRQASLIRFDVYLAADFLWVKLPRRGEVSNSLRFAVAFDARLGPAVLHQQTPVAAFHRLRRA